MKMRTEKEIIDLIIGFAQNDDRIRAVLMNGSRVNPNATKDIFQDYDIVDLVIDVEPFKDEDYILSHFGETIIIQKPEDKIYPSPVGDGRYNYNMQFLDGNRIDLSFFNMNRIDELTKDSLTEVLLDKDHIIPNLSEASESSYLIKEPTEKLFDDCCNEFIFGLASHIPKTIWRKELPLLKAYIDVVLRGPLINMLEWDIGIKTGFGTSIGKAGRHLQKYLEPEIYREFEQIYTDSNYDDIWNSLFLFYKLFKKTAESVAKEYGFQFPEETAKRALGLLKHIKQLPQDAKAIY